MRPDMAEHCFGEALGAAVSRAATTEAAVPEDWGD
jgi:hypothetical protein